MIRSVVKSISRPVRYAYLRLVRDRATPQTTAMGMALGVFIGLLPIIPFQTVTAVTLAFPLRCGKISAALGTLVSNPLNIPILYYFFYKVGIMILPFEGIRFSPRHLDLADLVQRGWEMLAVMIVGGLIFAIPGAVVAYFLTIFTIRRYHRLRAQRLIRKRNRELWKR